MKTSTIGNAGQVCGYCGSTNRDPSADYQNEGGILACSYRCYAYQTSPVLQGVTHQTKIEMDCWGGAECAYRAVCACGWRAALDWKARGPAEYDAEMHNHDPR